MSDSVRVVLKRVRREGRPCKRVGETSRNVRLMGHLKSKLG